MTVVLPALAALTAFLRGAFLVGGVVLAAVAAADWAVRTRRLNPFGGLARFLRARVDPQLVGVERRVLRAGGRPTATPLWALMAYVVAAMLVLAALEMLSSLLRQAAFATSLGAGGLLLLAVRWTFGFLAFALLVRVISSWIPGLGESRWLRWSYGATEWMLRPLRALLPSFGVIDITPIVAYFALQLLQSLVIEPLLLAALR
ncbi:MAG TPA: YggT family protein [Gemmatimonadaceae bacterium]|nr:YggT family protein [Gemmatimonadaceae bacterium]